MLPGDVELFRRELFFPLVIALERDWGSCRSTSVAMSFQASSRACGDDRQVYLLNGPAIGTMREKSACNSAGAAVETAEIAELWTLVS
jgi:hypothetical protein